MFSFRCFEEAYKTILPFNNISLPSAAHQGGASGQALCPLPVQPAAGVPPRRRAHPVPSPVLVRPAVWLCQPFNFLNL